MRAGWMLILLLLAVGIGLWITTSSTSPSDADAFHPLPSVSVEQMADIGKAINAYKRKHRMRPEALAELVTEQFAEPKLFFDADRENIPGVADDEFAESPDVFYMPALRASDPDDLLLCYSLMLKTKDGGYPVLFNDGRADELDRKELTRALNRTYEYLGEAMGK